MTYREFRDKYNGQYVDFDGYYGAQCWDLAQFYFTECLGLPSSVLSGCGLVSNMLYPPKRAELDKYFDEVSVYNMTEGDVCIWEYGHIAIQDHWDGHQNYFFSQNPNPSQVMPINRDGLHAFRLKTNKEITPNVEKDIYRDQIEVKVPDLRVREDASLNANILGKATAGYYNFYETRDNDGYKWYRIADSQWIASSDDWTTVYPAEKPKTEYINLPEWIDERNIYDVNTKERLEQTLKPYKFNGLSYKIYSYVDEFVEIETIDYGRVLVKVTVSTPITTEPQYKNGNY